MKPIVVIDGRPAQGKPRGLGIYTLRLVSALAPMAQTFDLKVALDRKAGEDPWPAAIDFGRLWGTAGNPVKWEQFELPRLAKESQAALLHHTANAAAWRPRTPYVVTVHDAIFMRRLSEASDSLSPRQVLAHWYYRYGVPGTAKRAELVLTDSEHSRAMLISRLKLSPEQVKTVYLGVPHPPAGLAESEVEVVLARHRLEKPYILGLGAMDPRKNTANLVRAFARLPRAAATALVLAGFEKAHRTEVPELIAHLGLKDRVKVLGFVPEYELTVLYQNAAAFVYPTRDEGFGLPILQAFSLGVPVLTSRVGAIPEVAGNAVRFANPEDPQSIAQELMTLIIDSGEAHRLALAGYLQAKHFSWEKTARETLGAYETVLSKIAGAPQAAPCNQKE